MNCSEAEGRNVDGITLETSPVLHIHQPWLSEAKLSHKHSTDK